MGRGERPRSASGLLVIEAPFVADPSLGVNIRTRLKGLTAADEDVLRQVGTLLGGLASKDLAERVRCGTDHDSDDWARRKRDLTAPSTSRWAGAITKASNQQWALSRRCQAAHIATLRRGIDTLDRRLEQEIGAKGSKGEPGGYRSRGEWFQKSRRREALRNKLAAAKADRAAGHVTVVRGGRKLANTRHNLEAAGITEAQWRHRWELARWFISADGETGKPGGNETIRLTGDGQLSLRLPDALIHLANAPWGRYVLSGRVQFSHRGQEWEAQVGANRAVAYTITLNPETGRG